ncbi:MAG TPA: glutathione S-transferase [Caulobacteraceae bacterium]|nr:glutathione S-transferase [Caulobacteraceae bacterium]
MLKVWGRRNSLNVQKVMWLVGELDLQHEHVSVGGPFGGLRDPGFGALNPNRLVPVIEDDGFVAWESHSIVRYLAARYGGEAWWPSDAAERTLSDRWMDWCLAHWQPAFLTGVFWGLYRTPEAQRDWVAIRRSVEQSAELMMIVEGQLSGRPFLTGERLAIGDIPVGASLFRYFAMDIERPWLPNVEAWYARLTERPAYREHVMVPFDDLKGRLAF